MSIQTIKKTPKPLILLKQIQNEHFIDLQKKHLSDTDLIEDIRQFCKQKAAADREYAQSMQKLILNLLAKRHFPAKENCKENDSEDLNVWSTWRDLLNQYQESANLRLNTADLLQKLSDQLKPIRINRLSTNKRILDQLKLLQTDLYTCVQEMIKAQKVYSEEEKQAHEIRIKAQDAAEKVKNKSTNIFNSMANLHKNSNKLSSRLDAYQTRSTAARNEYLFQLAAINAHLFSYFHVDLGDYAQIIDADVYDRFKELLVTITADEQNCSMKQSQVWLKLIKKSEKICRKYHWEIFLNNYPSFNAPVQYKFQSVKGDKIHLLVPLNLKENTLANVTKKLVKRLIVREHKIMGYEKEVKSFETGRVTPIQSATLSPAADSEVGVEDLISYNQEYVEHKVEELKFAIRKEKIEKSKIEACLGLLKDSGVDTDKILDDARTTVAAAAEMMKQNRSSEMDYSSPSISIEIEQPIDNPDYDEELSQINNEESFPYSLSKYSGYEYQPGSACSTPNKPQSYASTVTKSSDSRESINHEIISTKADINNEEKVSIDCEEDWVGDGGYGRAVAIFEFQASSGQWEELDLVVNEEVILLNASETDGWIKVRSLIDGREGIVPMSYLKVIYSCIPQSVTNEEENKNKDDYENIADYVNVLPISKVKSTELLSNTNKLIDGSDLVKTTYAFSSTNSDELQLEKNDIIQIISRVSQDGVDDGWWEGYKVIWNEEKNCWVILQRGFFPSMVVRKYIVNTLSKADLSPICPRIEPRKRPKIKLNFEKIKPVQNPNVNADTMTSETDVVGDYVRLASENEAKTEGDNLNLDIKEL